MNNTTDETSAAAVVPQPISVLIGALGGEGGGVLSEWLTAIARHAGYAAQSLSLIHI